MLSEKIALIGFGVSNKAVYERLRGCGYSFTVRSLTECVVPSELDCVFGENYLNTTEDIIFRSPSCMPYRIRGNGYITTEAAFALSHIGCRKICVTGSDGKTTVSTLIKEILSEDGKGAHLGGNIGYPVINYMGKLKKQDFLVCELSSFQLTDFSPECDVGIITNVTPNHLDIHSSYDEYKGAKANIFKNASRLVVNCDSGEAMELALAESGGRSITFASTRDIGGRLDDGNEYVYCRNGYIYRNSEKILPLSEIKLRGSFNILNVCLAVGAAYPYVSVDSIINTVKNFYGVSCRMELVDTKNGVLYYDSSIDSTPSRTLATLSAFDKSRAVVILGGYDKNLSYHALQEGLRGIKCAIICGANSEKIYSAVKNSCNTVLNDSFTESVKIAYRIAENGDSVILSPASASYDAFKNYREKSKKYREIIRGL